MTASQPNPAALSERDHAILRDLARTRLLTGSQLQRLHFADLAAPRTRANVRLRVLARLISLGLVTTLERRIGGVRAGSAGLIYALDVAGQRWAAVDTDMTGRIRRPWPIGNLFVAHTLDVAELYVRLREHERGDFLRLVRFDAEPASWHRSGPLLLKPDAYTIWTTAEWEVHRWIEVDRSTESLPTLRRKLLGYLDAAQSGDPGPAGVLPLVLVTVPSDRRLAAVRSLIAGLPEPAPALIETQPFATALTSISEPLAGGRPPP